MTIGVLVYRGVTTADIDVPVSALADRLGADVAFVGSEIGPIHGVEPSRSVIADVVVTASFHPEVVVIPGGLGWRQVASDDLVAAWIRSAAEQALGVLAISTGSLLLGSAGLLDGEVATGHWLAHDDLVRLGASAQRSRVASADHGRLVTAAGALAAVNAAHDLAERIRWGNPT